MSGQSALILGATGATGRHLLRELLLSPNYTRVGEFGRRVTPLDAPALQGVSDEGKGKLVQEIVDFEKIDEAKWKEGNWDVVFITLGTTKKQAGSAEAFEKIDRTYVVSGAAAARTSSASQRLIYLSSTGSSASSPFLYARSKGLTEQELVKLGYADTMIFRPGFLKGADRGSESRPLESIFGHVMGVASKISSSVEIHVADLAKAIRFAGQVRSSKLPASTKASQETFDGKTFIGIGNAGALALAKESS